MHTALTSMQGKRSLTDGHVLAFPRASSIVLARLVNPASIPSLATKFSGFHELLLSLFANPNSSNLGVLPHPWSMDRCLTLNQKAIDVLLLTGSVIPARLATFGISGIDKDKSDLSVWTTLAFLTRCNIFRAP